MVSGDSAVATVLVVDDNLDICRAMGKLVRRAGYGAEWVCGGEQALEYLQSGNAKPDLVILDEMMPGVDGLGVLHAIRSDDRTADVPVVIFTAMYDESFREKALNAGANDVWVKGTFDLDELPSELAKHIHVS